MASPSSDFSIYPLGDSAITIDLGNSIDDQRNRTALALYEWLRAHPFPGLQDIIMAYSSVSVFYDLSALAAAEGRGAGEVYSRLEEMLRLAWKEVAKDIPAVDAGGQLWELPVCYEGEYAPDIGFVAEQQGLSAGEVVELHTAVVYRVYMIGFLPGFPYLGTVDERLRVSRKPEPVAVRAGGVGIAGMQTGIYSLNSPGGWQIIGRTPVRLFEPHGDPPILVQAGDRVQFYPVSSAEFRAWSGVPASKPFQ
ncbi:MAG TPA: 5-oxoprolinase subunit PxpB [Puia sp.]|nr:5-oxoprolinase subunit PxpB [Puia sp.]